MNFVLWSMAGRPRKRSYSSRAKKPDTARGLYETCGFIHRFAEDIGLPKTCQWIEGEPKRRQFCGSANQPGSSYCEEHHARCYIKIKAVDAA